MNGSTDYQAAYLRQKVARERAEALLELRSRELYEANIALKQQAEELDSENRANKKLIERLSHVASQTSNGVVITGLDGCVQWVNDSFSNLMGRDEELFVGRPLQDVLLQSEADPRVISTIEVALSGLKPFSAEVFLGNERGSGRWARVNANAMSDSLGAIQGFMAILVDITQIKQAEQIKRELISTVSHELRTPLTSIMGAISLISSGVLGELPKVAEELLAVASRNSKRLLELIDDLLTMDKLAAGKLQLRVESLDLLPLLRQSIAELKPYADQYSIALVLNAFPSDLRLRCDARRFHQIMANLLSNAIKFSTPGCSVGVAVSTGPDKVRIEVIDSGQGIAEEFRSKVFDTFTQGDSSETRSSGGTGLGLAITRELVHQMGGEIGFESAVGRGTTFWTEWSVA